MAIYRAKEAFALPGITGRVVTPGSLMSDDDPDFKGREHLFEPVETAAARAASATETASAAPGERRTRSAGHKSAKAPEVKPDESEGDKE